MTDTANACACGGTCSTCANTSARSAVADPMVFRHGAIKARLLSKIGSTEIDGTRPLDDLGTRDDDDPAIALIDAVAGTLHVLAWNAARLSDDGAIRRTEDRDALVDLTRLLGYEPRPALAATTTLAFTLDNFAQQLANTQAQQPQASTLDKVSAPPARVKIPKGTKVASVPGPDEKPQTFETDAELEARVEWNELKPLQTQTPPVVTTSTTSITIRGTSTTAKPGDLILVYLSQQTSNSWLCGRIVAVDRDTTTVPSIPRTIITIDSPVGLPAPAEAKGSTFQNVVIVLGQRAAAFGATAPDLSLMSDEVRAKQKQNSSDTTLPTEWLNLKMPAGTTNGGNVYLDAIYADAVGGRLTVFSCVNATTLTQIGLITSATETARKGFGLAAKVTRISVIGIDLSEAGFVNLVRETAIYLQTGRETLLVTDDDVPMPATGADRITVNGKLEIPIGRRMVLSGEKWSGAGVTGSRIAEVATLKSSSIVSADPPRTELVFERALTGGFRAPTLTILGNCVGASHGETPARGAELIGSATAASLSPRFALKQSPLTYVPSSNARGYAPAIEVRVNERLYTEKPTLFELDSEDRAYIVKTQRGGTSEVQFAGRLPSSLHSPHNITALYRTGGGMAGNLAAGRLTMLMSPIVGVGKVNNVVPADGASDAETLEDMRTAAPQSIRTLDRVVSLGDFEAFARTRRGIGKALATELHVGMRSVVCLTIATTQIESPAPGSDIITSLRDALTLVTVPGRSIRIEGFTDFVAQLTVALAIDPTFRRADIESAVRAKLTERFGRAARSFGRALHRSEVLAAIQEVSGVIAARLTTFAATGLIESEYRLLCPGPTPEGGLAGLLSIDADQVQFEEMPS